MFFVENQKQERYFIIKIMFHNIVLCKSSKKLKT